MLLKAVGYEIVPGRPSDHYAVVGTLLQVPKDLMEGKQASPN